MTWRIDSMLRAGVLDNTSRNVVQGWLRVTGSCHPVFLHLTGNCLGRLAGKRIRFQTPRSNGGSRRPWPLQCRQIGPAGRIALWQVETGGRGGARWQLRLEWDGQDGRIRGEVWDPFVEIVKRWGPAPAADMQGGFWEPGPRNHLFDRKSPTVETRRWTSWADDAMISDEVSGDLFGTPLGEASPDHSEYERRIEELVSGRYDVPISYLFDPPLRLEPERRLDDRQVARALRRLLARLARHGIALDMCEHFSARDAYRLLVEEILREEMVYPELASIQYIQSFSTHEYCAQCRQAWRVDG